MPIRVIQLVVRVIVVVEGICEGVGWVGGWLQAGDDQSVLRCEEEQVDQLLKDPAAEPAASPLGYKPDMFDDQSGVNSRFLLGEQVADLDGGGDDLGKVD